MRHPVLGVDAGQALPQKAGPTGRPARQRPGQAEAAENDEQRYRLIAGQGEVDQQPCRNVPDAVATERRQVGDALAQWRPGVGGIGDIPTWEDLLGKVDGNNPQQRKDANGFKRLPATPHEFLHHQWPFLNFSVNGRL